MKKALTAIVILFCAFSIKATLSLPFVKYEVENGLSHNTVWWLGQGIYIYNPKNKTMVQNTTHSSFVLSLIETSKGKIYATSRLNGLICFDINGKYIRSFLPPANNKNGLNNIEISALCLQNNSISIWFNVGTYGFCKLDLATEQIKSVAENNNSSIVSNIRSIFPVSKNKLWVGGDNGLYYFDTKSEKFTRLDDPLNPKSLNDQSVYDITRDQEGGMWVSTYFGGVNYLSKNLKPFEHYLPQFLKGSISGKAISQFCEDPSGNIWIATEDGGLKNNLVYCHANLYRKLQK